MSTQHNVTAGIDLGDRYSHLCLLDVESGEVIKESRIATSLEAFERRISGTEPMLVAIETGTHSPGVSRMLEDSGYAVLPRGGRWEDWPVLLHIILITA